MTQTRIHDYRGPRSSEDLNRKLIGLLPAGVYRGLHVGGAGAITPGLLLTAEGVTVEEDAPVSVLVPPGDPTHGRVDLVVCVYEYMKTVPAPVATFEVVQGTPAADPVAPELPDHAILLAVAQMEAGGSEWTSVEQVGPPEKLVNATRQADFTYTIVHGARATLREVFDPNTGTLAVYLVAAGTLSDGDPIPWGDPVLSMSPDGIDQLAAIVAALEEEIGAREAADELKLDKTGGTLTGGLVVGNGETSGSPEIRQRTNGADGVLRTLNGGDITLHAEGAGKHVVLRPGAGGLVVIEKSIYGDVGALQLKDENGASVDLSSEDDIAIAPSLPQNLIGALNVTSEHVSTLTQALGTELLEGALVTAGVGLNVTVSVGQFLTIGRHYAMAETSRELDDDATNYLYWDRVTKAYGHSTTWHQFQAGTRVALAKVVTAAGAITSVADFRKPLAWLNERSEILVGPVGTLGVHFTSVGAALRYVGENLAPALGTATRNYRIRVVGHVVEAGAPLVIPANGIVIEGLGGDSTAPATPGKSVVEWAGDVPLFDLNGKDYLVFRDFVAGYNGTTAAATAADRRAVFYANAQASSHCVFENIRVKNYGSAANTLHGMFWVGGVLGAITNSVIRDVYAAGLANFGMIIRDCQDTKIENIHLTGAPAYACPTFEDDGIYLPKFGASEHIRVRDCHVQGFGGQGIYVGGSYVVVDANRVEDCEEWGIYVALGAIRCVVSKNSVEGCSTSPGLADGIGIYIVGDDCRVSDNYAVVMNDTAGAGGYVAGLALNAARCSAVGNNLNASGAGGATLRGILFGNSSAGSCVAVGNHLNGRGFTDLPGGNFCDVAHGNQP
jgi:hypothetical protein